MLRRSHRANSTLRIAVLLLATLHLGAAAVLPGIDAVLEAQPLSAPAHVESPGNEDCAAHHDHLFCQVVRSLASAFSVTPPDGIQHIEGPVLVHRLDHHRSDIVQQALIPGLAPRAPPLG